MGIFKKKRVFLSFLLMLWIVVLGAVSASAASKSVPTLTASKKVAVDQDFSLVLKKNSKPVKWTISKKGIVSKRYAKGNEIGLTAVGAGTTAVTARVTGSAKGYTCRVTVYDPIKIKGASSMYQYGYGTLSVEGTKKSAGWSSSDSSVVSVQKISAKKARITAKKPGTVYITAKISGRTYKKKIAVTKNTARLKIAVADCNSGEDGLAQSAISWLGASASIVGWNCDVSQFDGLVVPGGVDVNPVRYKERNVASGGVNDNQDYMQLNLIKRFITAGKPVFGICRGHQLINVYFGGSLIQHVPNHGWRMHNVKTEKGSRLWSLYGASLSVRSSHHQAVKKVGKGLKVTQRADDGVVEALEHESLPVFSVQWHPELMGSTGSVLLKSFLKECRKYREWQ